jgi:LuxR family transcriptional regulator, maltose regulon positive regulatory protein
MTGLRPVAKFPNTRYDALPEEHMAAKTPTVRDGVLYRQHEHEVYVDTPAWFAWLQEATTFAFRDDMGTFTARKERQRGGTYWRAYRKRDGVLRRCYLGRSPDLSRKHLEHAAQRLAEGDPPNQAHVPRTHGAHRDTRRAIPAPPTHLLPRPALLRRLDSDAWRVMLVSAPAGYGKTTLVGAWARTLLLRGEPCLWLALTQYDDANRLWRRLAQALDGHYPGVVPSGDMDADTLLGLLDSVPHTITVVLDDYDRAASRAVHAAIARVVGHAPSRLRLVLLCRADPPLPLHRWRAHGILAELRVPNLRFDDDEAAALVGAVRGSPPSPSALATIQSIAEGWPPVVRLVALAADDEAPSVLLPDLADYIAQDVWADLTPDMQRFVSATSVLDTLCEALCAAVTHADDAHMLLDRLARAQLLHPATGETHGWYRYHPLVAAWGREYLAQRDPHATARALRTASASALARSA